MRGRGRYLVAKVLALAAVGLMCWVVLSTCSGCTSWLPGRLKGPSAQHESWIMGANGTVSQSKTVIDSGSASGDSVEKLELGELSVDAAGGTTGGMRFKGLKLPQFKPLYLIGGLAVVAGAVLGYFVGWGFGLVVAGSGAALVVGTALMEQYPWVLFIPAIGAVATAAWFVWKLSTAKGEHNALSVIVSALDELEPERGPVKTAINAKAEANGDASKIEAAVARVKKQTKKES